VNKPTLIYHADWGSKNSKRWCAKAKQRDGEVDCDYWKRTRNGVKKRLIESYRNGQKSKVV